MNASAYGRYQEMDVLSMHPARRVVLLYTHILLNLRQAKLAAESSDIELRTAKLIKAQEIVEELRVTLDHETGGEIARNLASLYAYLLTEILGVSIRYDAARLDRLTALVAELHGAWQQAAEQVAATGPAMARTA